MYYKITNKEAVVYKKLHALRTNEYKIQKENEEAILEKTGLNYDKALANFGQQNWNRVTQYTGFVFLEPEKVDLKIWKKDKNHKEAFVPNPKTKLGREMQSFLFNGLKGSVYHKVFDILNLPDVRKFTFPYVEIVEDVVLVFLGDNQEPNIEDLIEITKTEFNKILESK